MTRSRRPATLNLVEALLHLAYGNRPALHERPAQLALEGRHVRQLTAHPAGALAQVPCCRKPLTEHGNS